MLNLHSYDSIRISAKEWESCLGLGHRAAAARLAVPEPFTESLAAPWLPFEASRLRIVVGHATRVTTGYVNTVEALGRLPGQPKLHAGPDAKLEPPDRTPRCLIG